ncbi:MAG: FAD-binding oxidoreductase [Saprospiraceae bacterium]|nr:FAD-binding oxidoreductase [Saprospiraceae bacterium]
MKKYDFGIVGAGLAGNWLAYQLSQQFGSKVVLFGGNKSGEASSVSSGVIKPITGRKYVKTWNYENLWGTAFEMYKVLEGDFGIRIWYDRDILVELKTAAHSNEWFARSQDPEYAPMMHMVPSTHLAWKYCKTGSDLGLLSYAAQVDIPLLSNSLNQKLIESGIYRESEFSLDELTKVEAGWVYQGELFEKIVFCDGARGSKNPYCNSIELFPLKGECMIVRLKEEIDFIFQSDYSIVPFANHKFWLGSNYNLKDQNYMLTEFEKINQINFLDQITKGGFELETHLFGFRSTTRDRRPIIGELKNFQGLFIFNGFGTKGASLIPYSLKSMVNLLVNNIQPEANINSNRFKI